jgi:uncharacterized membrane protein
MCAGSLGGRWHLQACLALCVDFFHLFSFMKTQKFATDDAYSPALRHSESRAFDALSRILVVLMGAAFVFFGFLLAPAEWSSVTDELLGWCVAGVVAVVALIVVVGLIERLTD